MEKFAVQSRRTDGKTSSFRWHDAWAWTLMILPAGITTFALIRYFTAVPILDDFFTILPFSVQFQNTSGFLHKLSLVLFTNTAGVYKLAFLQGVLGMQMAVTGHVNIAWLIVIGNLSLAGIFLLLILHTPLRDANGKLCLLRCLPVSLLLFGLNYAETVNWALCSMQQLAGVVFGLAAIHFMISSQRRKGKTALGLLFAFLSVSANAPGLLLFPIGVLFALLNFRVERKGFSKARPVGFAAIWAFAGLLAFAFYRFRPGTAILTAHNALWSKALFAVIFCGSAVENMHHRPIPYFSVILGAVVLATLLFAACRRFDRVNPFFAMTALWMVAIACTVANTRIAMGMELALSSRYKIYCDLLLICCFEFLLSRRIECSLQVTEKQRKPLSVTAFLSVSIAVTSLFFWGSEINGFRFLHTRQLRAETAYAAWVRSNGEESPMFLVTDRLSPGEVEMEDKGRRQLNDAVKQGTLILQPPR